ncbi:MAG: hypothetical protein IPI88_07285 [Chitinophagaceae bacterium]|nr:hypothetical protein [Chitinophagaceae bacterium]
MDTELVKSPFAEAEKSLLILANKDERFNLDYYETMPENKEKQKFTYLRSVAINVLIQNCFEVFIKHYDEIISFEFDKDLIKSGDDKEIIDSLDSIKAIVKKYVYKWHEVLTVEAAGFEILGASCLSILRRLISV